MASTILYSTSASVIALPEGTNRCVVVAIANANDGTFPTVSFNGVAMNVSASYVYTTNLSAQLLHHPTNLPAGNYDLTFSGAKTGYYTYVLDNVDQTSPVEYSAGSSNNAVGAGSVSITCTSGAIELSALATGTGDGSHPVGLNVLTADSDAAKWGAGHNNTDLSGAQTLTWDWSSTRSYTMTAVTYRVNNTDYYATSTGLLQPIWIM